MWTHFFSINLLFRSEVLQRKDFPLGDESYTAPLLKASHTQVLELRPFVSEALTELRVS
jgi:hypothetical protein